MKLAVIGATGFVGSAIVHEALQRGHEVMAIVRHPEKVTPQPKLHSQQGDVYNADEVARLAAGHDAVISAFNPGWSDQEIYDHHVQGVQSMINGVRKPASRGCCSWEEPAAWR